MTDPAAPAQETTAPETSAPATTAQGTPVEPVTQAAPRPWFVSLLLAVSIVTLMLSGAWLFTRAKSPYPFFGTSYNPPPPKAAVFSGTDDLGRPFTFNPQGQTTAIFFGFTNCANICPLSLSYLNKARNALPQAQQDRFKILFISVDPLRDTPARMHDYVTYFGQGTGVIIQEPKLGEVARAYGVGYQKVDVKGLQEYQINHTTASYLIDAGGNLRALWDYTQLPQVERVKQDIQYVMENPLP